MNKSFRFVYDKKRIDKASQFRPELDRDSFLKLLMDFYILSEADYFVGVFNSSVDRFNYGLIQSYKKRTDKILRVKSLENYFFVNN